MEHPSSLNPERCGGWGFLLFHSTVSSSRDLQFTLYMGPGACRLVRPGAPACPQQLSSALSLTAALSLYMEQEGRAQDEAKISAEPGRNLTGLRKALTATPGLG